ncbi:MAG: hypothetical protein M5U34_24530 [Chloroflexi bacterium]|nr:hypothetical protein [Chloroflexota bacterium]
MTQPTPSPKSNSKLWLIFSGAMLIAFCLICLVGLSLTGAILAYRYDELAHQPTTTPFSAFVAQATPLPPLSQSITDLASRQPHAASGNQ